MVKIRVDKRYPVENILNPLEKILDIIFAFNSESRYEKLLDILVAKMMEITNSDAGTLYIIENNKLNFRIVKNISLDIHQTIDDTENLPPISLDETNIENVSAYAAINNEIIIIDDVYKDESFNFVGPKNYDRITGYRTCSMLVMPLVSYNDDKPEVLGVIQLLNATDPKTGEVVSYNGVYDLSIITALSNIAANTLANMLHTQEVHLLFNSLVAVMTQAIDERSAYNKHHTQNVAVYCKAFAEYLSSRFPPDHPYYFTDRRIEALTVAANLHDIGKIIVPLEIMDKSDRLGRKIEDIRHRFVLKGYQLEIEMLRGNISKDKYKKEEIALKEALEFVEKANKISVLDSESYDKVQKLKEIVYQDDQGETVPIFTSDDIESLSIRSGTFTRRERTIMQEHVEITKRLLYSITFWKYYKDVPEWVINHHELLDGSGYPRGLSLDNIPFESCLLTIVDIFDALVAVDRPYKDGVPIEDALNILKDMAKQGKLHSELVELFSEGNIWENAVGAYHKFD